MIRHIQYIMKTEHGTNISAERIMDAIAEPKVVVVPQNINEDFLLIEKLEPEMTLTKFRAATILDLNPQLKALVQ